MFGITKGIISPSNSSYELQSQPTFLKSTNLIDMVIAHVVGRAIRYGTLSNPTTFLQLTFYACHLYFKRSAYMFLAGLNRSLDEVRWRIPSRNLLLSI